MSYGVELIWEGQTEDKSHFVKKRIDEILSVRCFIATNGITGNRSFLIDFGSNIKISEFTGQRFKGVELQILQRGTEQELAIILMENSLANIFCLFTEDILKEISDCKTEAEALSATFRIINSWKRMFDSLNLSGLTPEQQKGLFGELYFIRQSILYGIDFRLILESWTGPDALNQDFIVSSTGIEVKTTSANHPVIQISNELQLSQHNLDFLFLYLIVISERKGHLITLNSLVTELREILAGYTNLIELFNDKLSKAGYNDDHVERYEDREYIIREVKIYRVTEGFPCITAAELSEGVYDVKYKIETSACTDFKILPEVLFAEIA